MISVLASSAIDCGFEPRLGQTKEYKIGMCCFSAKHAALRSKSKDWLARNQNNVFELLYKENVRCTQLMRRLLQLVIRQKFVIWML